MGAKKLYRRVSITTVDGRKEPYNAKVTIEIDAETGKTIYRVFSKVLEGKCHTFMGTGNAVEDHEHLESVCQRVHDFDSNFGVKAAPKPPKSTSAEMYAHVYPLCPMCGGYGYVTDEDGYDHLCECRR